ncbi:MAG: hypothetical protein R3Y51_03275 [Rikenellaceae bacterium]
MKLKTLLLSLCVVITCSCGATKEAKKSENSLPYVMDMFHRNPGEPNQESKYHDYNYVAGVGYNAVVPMMYVQCALTYDSFDEGLTSQNAEEKAWIMNQQAIVKEQIKNAKAAGLQVFPFTDMLVLPTSLIEKYKNELVDQSDLEAGHNSVHGKMAPNINRDMTSTVIKAQIKEIFETFPDIDGLVIRFGETYLYDTPFHSGGNPVRGRGEEGINGHVKLIELLKAEVCEKYNKKLFYRTWDFGFFHTNPETFKSVTSQVEPHENLTFSIKYSRGDFHRLTQFNTTIGLGDHPYIIEFQGQPEYYGKGSHPVYVFGGALNGFSEYQKNMEADQIKSIAELKGDSKFKGLWTWSRGGGWRGPYIKHELWCDINAQSASVWAQDTTQTESQVLDKVLTNLSVKESSLADFKELLKLADEAVLKGQCTDLDLPFNVWWTRDQYFYHQGTLAGFFKGAIDKDMCADVIAEKDYAVGLWDRIVELSKKIEMTDADSKTYLEVSSEYGRYKFDIIRQIFIMGLNNRNFELNGKVLDKEALKAAIAKYETLYADWKKLEEENPLCANIYEPYGFNLTPEKGAYGSPDNGVCILVDKCRELVK